MRFSGKKILLLSIFTALMISGCYTQLMTPQEYMSIRKSQSSVSIVNNTYSINYNQSCTTCHSVAELNERAEELESYGVLTVHDGVLLSSQPWLNENPYADQGPIYWPEPNYPILVTPWWAPPVTVVTVPVATTPGNGNRPRPNGSTRDNPPNGGRDNPIPAPTTAQPPAPVGGTTVPVSTPSAPSVIITPAPASPAAKTSDEGRTRDTNNSSTTTTTKTRSDGQSRDSSDRSRPR